MAAFKNRDRTDGSASLIGRLSPTVEPLYREVLAKLTHFLATVTQLSHAEAAVRAG